MANPEISFKRLKDKIRSYNECVTNQLKIPNYGEALKCIIAQEKQILIVLQSLVFLTFEQKIARDEQNSQILDTLNDATNQLVYDAFISDQKSFLNSLNTNALEAFTILKNIDKVSDSIQTILSEVAQMKTVATVAPSLEEAVRTTDPTPGQKRKVNNEAVEELIAEIESYLQQLNGSNEVGTSYAINRALTETANNLLRDFRELNAMYEDDDSPISNKEKDEIYELAQRIYETAQALMSQYLDLVLPQIDALRDGRDAGGLRTFAAEIDDVKTFLQPIIKFLYKKGYFTTETRPTVKRTLRTLVAQYDDAINNATRIANAFSQSTLALTASGSNPSDFQFTPPQPPLPPTPPSQPPGPQPSAAAASRPQDRQWTLDDLKQDVFKPHEQRSYIRQVSKKQQALEQKVDEKVTNTESTIQNVIAGMIEKRGSFFQTGERYRQMLLGIDNSEIGQEHPGIKRLSKDTRNANIVNRRYELQSAVQNPDFNGKIISFSALRELIQRYSLQFKVTPIDGFESLVQYFLDVYSDANLSKKFFIMVPILKSAKDLLSVEIPYKIAFPFTQQQVENIATGIPSGIIYFLQDTVKTDKGGTLMHFKKAFPIKFLVNKKKNSTKHRFVDKILEKPSQQKLTREELLTFIQKMNELVYNNRNYDFIYTVQDLQTNTVKSKISQISGVQRAWGLETQQWGKVFNENLKKSKVKKIDGDRTQRLKTLFDNHHKIYDPVLQQNGTTIVKSCDAQNARGNKQNDLMTSLSKKTYRRKGGKIKVDVCKPDKLKGMLTDVGTTRHISSTAYTPEERIMMQLALMTERKLRQAALASAGLKDTIIGRNKYVISTKTPVGSELAAAKSLKKDRDSMIARKNIVFPQ